MAGASVITRRGVIAGVATIPLAAAAFGALTRRSAVEWFSDAEQAAARSGDLSLDHTAAIQRAIDSGASVIDMNSYTYRIDGTVKLPPSGITITGTDWTAQRGAGVVNNSGRMFSAVGATKPITLENGKLTGNVRRGSGYSPFAAGLYFEDCTGGVTLTDIESTGFAEGAYVLRVVGFTVIRGVYAGNKVTGISGSANEVLIDGGKFYANGSRGSGGRTHDLYFINSTKGVIRNFYIGNPVDSASDSLVIRYDRVNAVEGFNAVDDWEIYDGRFVGGGFRTNSLGPTVADRRPPNDIRVHDNLFSNGADLRFDEPQACKSWNNRGIDRLMVGVGSTYVGYVVGYTSEMDECNGIYTNALFLKRSEARAGIVFKNTLIRNGLNPAINAISGYGGYTTCTVVEPRIIGNGAMSRAIPAGRYQVTLEK